MKISEMLGD